MQCTRYEANLLVPNQTINLGLIKRAARSIKGQFKSNFGFSMDLFVRHIVHELHAMEHIQQQPDPVKHTPSSSSNGGPVEPRERTQWKSEVPRYFKAQPENCIFVYQK